MQVCWQETAPALDQLREKSGKQIGCTKHLRDQKIKRDRRAFLNSKHGVKHKIKVAYDMYPEDILGLNEDSGNQIFCRKKLFSFLKSSLADSQGIAVLRKGDTVCTENVGQADLLNSQFQSVFSVRSPLDLAKLCHSKILNGITSLINLLPESMSCMYPTIRDFEVSPVGVAKLLSNLNVAKSAGPDSIRPVVLKELSQVISSVVSINFQTSLDTGTVPSDWKKAQVCRPFKNGDKTDPANYRPISLTCILCKTMEHIVVSNMTKHFNQNNILYDLQHGFHENRSSETQLIQLVEDDFR